MRESYVEHPRESPKHCSPTLRRGEAALECGGVSRPFESGGEPP